MLASRPLAEKRQRSAAASPVAGRRKATGFPASEQELLAMEKAPSAAVVGSTRTMSFVVAEGAALVREMISSEGLGAATTRETLLEVELSGLRTWTKRLPGAETSAEVTGAVHSVTEMQVVVRAAPAINKTEPGPGVEATKLPPSTRRVKPLAAPA